MLFGVSVVHFFLLLSSTPLYGYLIVSHVPAAGHLNCFQSLANTNKTDMHIQVALYYFGSPISDHSSSVSL